MRTNALPIHLPYREASHAALMMLPPESVRRERLVSILPETAQAFFAMRLAALQESVHLVALSGFRSVEEQRVYFKDAQRRHGNEGAKRWVAPPGHSEHATGYVLDLADFLHPETDDELSFAATAGGRWLEVNARRFFFENSFPSGNWQGIGPEPWHFRFIGNARAFETFQVARRVISPA